MSILQKPSFFLKIKDPSTFFDLITLGKELPVADRAQYWTNIRHNQEKILKEKKIKHRNFGDYSKHNCGYETCPMNGVMIRQRNVLLASCSMSFDSDKSRWNKKEKSETEKKNKKKKITQTRLMTIFMINNDTTRHFTISATFNASWISF